MEIKHKELEHKGMFYVEVNGKRSALMTYTKHGDKLITIDHTEVDDSLRGKNIGYQLVKAGAEYARANDLKIIPVCEFAKAIFEKRAAEFEDVLKK